MCTTSTHSTHLTSTLVVCNLSAGGLAAAAANTLASNLRALGGGVGTPQGTIPVPFDSPSRNTRHAYTTAARSLAEQYTRADTPLDSLKAHMVPNSGLPRVSCLVDLLQATWVMYQHEARVSPRGTVQLDPAFIRGLYLASRQSKSGDSLLPELKKLLGGSSGSSHSSAKTILAGLARLVTRHAEVHLTHMAPDSEAVIKLVVLHDFSSVQKHLASFLPQFVPSGSSFFGKDLASSANRVVANIPDLLQAFTGFAAVSSPFLCTTEATNIVEMGAFVSLVQTHMLGVPGCEDAFLSAFFQAATEAYEDWATSTALPDSPPPTVSSLLASPTFLATTNRLTLKAQVVSALGSSTPQPGAGASPRTAAPASSSDTGAGGAPQRPKRKSQSPALGDLPTHTAGALKEWRSLTARYSQTHRNTPRSTMGPCFFFLMCGPGDTSCSRSGRCPFWHARPPVEDTHARNLFDAVTVPLMAKYQSSIPLLI
jgi:hypothetical protein